MEPSKILVVADLVKMAMIEGFMHNSRFCKKNFRACSPDEQPGYRLKKYMQVHPEKIETIQRLKAEDFNHRIF